MAPRAPCRDVRPDMTIQTAQLSQSLQSHFEDRAALGRPMVLATVVSTSGSTYSKCGHQMLINEDGTYQGVLSGGCLEGDLSERARIVLESRDPAFVEYDLHGDDSLFGLGVGCDGVIRILLQPLLPDTGYEPFAGFLRELQAAAVIDVHLPGNESSGEPAVHFRLCRPRRVLILGAGTDAEPLLQIAHAMGWRLALYDHRPGYVSQLRRPDGCTAVAAPADDLAEQLDLTQFDAVIVMSHHLASDRSYLTALASSSVPFVGLLGPSHRRDRLLGELGPAADALRERLRSPVGRQIGGRGPAPIALEIAAELQAYFCAAD